MKYRIRELIIYGKRTYYPERKILWWWCGYSNNTHPEFSSNVYFKVLSEAKQFIARKCDKTKVIYHYYTPYNGEIIWKDNPMQIHEKQNLKPQFVKSIP